jgi:hypothetical protein
MAPLAVDEAASTLARNAFNLAALGARGVNAIARLAAEVPCHDLVVGDLDEAVALVHRHLGAR